MRIRTQLAASHLILGLAVLLIALGLLSSMARSHFLHEAHETLRTRAEDLANLMAVELLFRGLRAPTLPDDRLQTIARTAAAMIEGDFAILSTTGELLTASNGLLLPPDPRERLELDPIRRALETGETVSDRTKGQDGTDMLAAFAPITLRDGRPPIALVITFRPEAAAVASARDMQRMILQAGALALAAATLISLLAARTLSDPAERLSHAARALRRGDLRQRAPDVSTAEFAQVARMINHVAARLSDSLQKRRAFIASISHEIRTPVTSIRGFVQALQDGVISEEEEDQYLETILDETRRIQRMLEDLLQLERLETGQMSMQYDWVSTEELLDRAASRIAHAARRRNIEVKIETPGEGVLQVWADAERLDQVLGNLTENALRYAPPHGTIEMGVRPVGGGDNPERALFWVADDGPGIPEEQIDSIFETFHQIAESPHEGAGLGLAICRQIISRHRGSIWAENRPEGGALFQFSLPHVRLMTGTS